MVGGKNIKRKGRFKHGRILKLYPQDVFGGRSGMIKAGNYNYGSSYPS
jgi:hypothetical protein